MSPVRAPEPAWRQALAGRDAARARALAAELATARRLVAPRAAEDLGLMRGLAGDWLLARARDDARRAARARRLVADGAARLALDGSLFDGLCGVGWLAAQGDDADSAAGIDAVLARLLGAAPRWSGAVDLFAGLAGMGFFLARPGASPDARVALAHVVRHLEATATPAPGGAGLAWMQSPAQLNAEQLERTPHGRFELGMAHGAAGILPTLAAAVRAGVETGRAASLLDGAAAWLLAHARRRAPLPTCVTPAGERLAPMPGWCRGSLGVAAGLHAAGALADVPAWRAAAARLALRTLDEPLGDEACLCHGTAGAALVAQRFAAVTGDARFARRARALYRRTLALAPRVLRGEGLMFGAVGVAAALAAATAVHPPPWTALLVGYPPPVSMSP